MTDIDVLAVRLPGAGRIVPQEGGNASQAARVIEPHSLLVDEQTDRRIDFIIAEVKEAPGRP